MNHWFIPRFKEIFRLSFILLIIGFLRVDCIGMDSCVICCATFQFVFIRDCS